MESTLPAKSWIPLRLLRHRFIANVDALAGRLPVLAGQIRSYHGVDEYFLISSGLGVQLGVKTAAGISPVPITLDPNQTLQVLQKLFPGGICNQGVLVVGEDMGWLWNGLAQLRCSVSAAPGHRPPLFFLMKNLGQLWILLHIHDWRGLLADSRVQFFVGDDAFEQFRQTLLADLMTPWPRLCACLDPSLFPPGQTLDTTLQWANEQANQQYQLVEAQQQMIYAMHSPQSLAEQFSSNRPLKILGITSRHTTFLRYSMRDWLDAFDCLGHCTHLLMESADHQLLNKLALAKACADFRPDLIVMIDHYRAELGGIPQQVPVVMWVQDAMPTIFCANAGAAQGPLDYAMGFARPQLVYEFGYPAERYLPAIVGVNEKRFAPRPSDDPELAQYSCDACLVTHASVPADQIVKEQIDRNGTPEGKRLLTAIFDQLRAVYEAGKTLVAPAAMRRIIDQGFIDSRTQTTPELVQQLMDLFHQRVNNALFRHQSVNWLAELGVDLRLYGRGWENHPKFKRFARGVANHEGQLPLIYQASRINLHISPTGSLHQRVMEGLASGGFFLLRRSDCDIVGRHYEKLWDYCQKSGITTDRQLQACTDPEIQETLRQTIEIFHCDPFSEKQTFMQLLQATDESEYLCSAGCIWAKDYDETSFNSKAELEAKVAHFLSQPMEQQRLRQSMLEPVLERFTYAKISSRLLAMIAADQARAAPIAA